MPNKNSKQNDEYVNFYENEKRKKELEELEKDKKAEELEKDKSKEYQTSENEEKEKKEENAETNDIPTDNTTAEPQENKEVDIDEEIIKTIHKSMGEKDAPDFVNFDEIGRAHV